MTEEVTAEADKQAHTEATFREFEDREQRKKRVMEALEHFWTDEIIKQFSPEEQRDIKRFFMSFSDFAGEEPVIADMLFNFTIRQFTEDSARADLNFGEYSVCMKNMYDGLTDILLKSGIDDQTDVILRREIFRSTHNFFIMMFSRVLDGKGIKQEIELLRAKTPQQVITRPGA